MPADAQSTQPPSASLLRRLAEAADGYRTGQPVMVIARRAPPHEVHGVFPAESDWQAELDKANQANPGYEAFGPYVTQADPQDPAQAPLVAIRQVVTSIDGIIQPAVVYDESFPPVDAVFVGLPAWDKFIGPYLAKVHGVVYAAQERQKVKTTSEYAKMKPHYLHSF
jgi:hypothetical protein